MSAGTATAAGNLASTEAEAQQARADVDDAEHGISSGKQPASAKRLLELVTRSRHADLAAQAAKAQAEQDRQAARAKSLDALGTEIDKVAAEGGSPIAAALRDVADAASRVRAAAAAHDLEVAELAETATALGCRQPAPGGPRDADGQIAVFLDGKVQHGETLLSPAARLDKALAHALEGDAVSAVAELLVCKHVPRPQRATMYLRGRGGLITPIYGEPDIHQASALRSGALVRLSESQVLEYLAGDSDGR